MNSDSLTTRRYYEIINPELIQKIINVLRQPDYNFRDHEDTTELIGQLEAISKRIKKNRNLVTYEYSKSILPNKYGRVFPFKNLSLGALPREIRGTLAIDNYVDIDICNCQPTLLEQLFKKYNLKTKCLTKYINDRESVLNEIINHYNVTRQIAKNLFIILLFNGTFNTWANENAITEKPTKFIESFHKEILANYNFILKCPDFKNDIEIIKQADKIKDYNEQGTVVAWILQNIERNILETMITYIKNYKYDVSNVVLCFDGFLMTKGKYHESLLNRLETYVLENTGYSIKLAVKPFETIELPETITEYIAPESNKFKHEIMQECCKYSYNSAKEYFERFFVFVENLSAFVRIDTMQQYDTKKLKESYKFKDAITNADFIKTWVEDTNRRRVEDIIFKPFSGASSVQNKIISEIIDGETVEFINTFKGFSPEINNQATEDNVAEFNDFIENYFKPVVKNLCEDNEQFMDHVIKYFAQLIQLPAKRPERALVFVSDQGEGKGRLLDTITRVIGKHNYHTSSNYKQDFFSNHSVSHANKLLVNADESTAAGNFDLEGLIKTFITTQMITINEKYKTPYQLENFARMIFTSNKMMSVPIDFESGDRRFDLFESAHKYSKLRKDNQEESERFWRHYSKVIDSDYFPSLMYNYLNSIDISEWNSNALQNVETKLKKTMTAVRKDNYKEFFEEDMYSILKEYYNQNHENNEKSPEIIKAPVNTIYNHYQKYCENIGEKPAPKRYFSIYLFKFYNDIMGDKSITSNGTRYYIIDYKKYCETFDYLFI